MWTRLAFAVCCAASLWVSIAGAADKPQAEANATPAYLIGEMHVQTMPSMNYLYGTSETTLEKITEPIDKHLTACFKARAEGKISSDGRVMYVYHDLKDITQPFKFDAGLLVPDQTQPPAGLSLRKTEPFRCATILYTGAMADFGKAWEKLYAALTKAGYTPTAESREMHLYWENPTSKNNVIQIQVGIR